MQTVLKHTQLFGAGQQILLIGEDVVEDEELGGDGVALARTSAAALPLLTQTEQNHSNKSETPRK